jgi:hypothetical protein
MCVTDNDDHRANLNRTVISGFMAMLFIDPTKKCDNIMIWLYISFAIIMSCVFRRHTYLGRYEIRDTR